MKSIILTTVLIGHCLFLEAQSNLDSLLSIWQDETLHDSVRVVAYRNYIFNGYIYSQPDSAALLAEKLHEYAAKHAYPKASASGYHLQGVANWLKGDYPKALECYNRSLKISKKLGNKNGESSSLSGIGTIYKEQGNYPKALDYFHRCLEIEEESHDESAIAKSLNNIGNIYKNQHEYALALDHYQRSLAIKEKLGDKPSTASNYHNIGVIYDRQGNYPLALEYYHKARMINEESGNRQWLANNLSNIGLIHEELGEFTLALEFLERSLTINRGIGNRESIAASLIDIGGLYRLQKKYSSAIDLCQQGRSMAAEVGAKEWQKSACECLYKTFKEMGRNADALTYYEQMIVIRDSLYNEENTKKITRLEMQYNFDKKEAVALAEQTQQKALAAQELKRQKFVRNAFMGGFLLVAIFAAVFFLQRNRIAKEKKLAEYRKLQVEEKNRAILDSIEYAKRIQTAILPPPRVVKGYLKNSFILYLPKDIVAGDFYWMDGIDDTVYFAACDCTGHGVPGAMVSVVCNTALNRSLHEFELREPGKIFDKTRELVLDNFARSDEDVKDGMDASLCALNFKTNRLLWSGANNPLWIYRATEKEIEEVKADKQPIGMGYGTAPFNTHEITLHEGDLIYIFTDGYADQFGGEKEKKLTKGRFRDLLKSRAHLSMEQQREELLRFHDQWRGQTEQIDDICVIGVRV